MSHTNTIQSLSDLTNYNPKEYVSPYQEKAESEKVIAIMFLTAFFAYIIYKLVMFQYMTNDRLVASVRNLEGHMEVAETHLIEHGARIEEGNQTLIDSKGNLEDIQQKIKQLREDLNLMMFSFKHLDMKFRRMNGSIPDIMELATYILDREDIIQNQIGNNSGEHYNAYRELCHKVMFSK